MSGERPPAPAPDSFWSGRRVVFLSGTPGDTRRYRCEYAAEQLRLVGAAAEVVALEAGGVDDAILDETELLVVHRVEWSDEVADLIAASKSRATPTVFDTDDLVFDATAAGDTPWYLGLPLAERAESFVRQRRTMEACGAATVSTRPLAYRAREVCPRVAVTFNAVGEEVIREADAARRPAHEPRLPTIAYLSGTPTHDGDFLEAAEPLLSVLQELPGACLLVVGHLELDDRFAVFGERVERLAFQPRHELPALLAACAVSIAPLRSGNPFAAAKSCLKYLEAGVVGVPTVASPVPDFIRAIDSPAKGLLAASPSVWHRALRGLLDDPMRCREVGACAREDVLARHTTRARAPELARAFEQLVVSGRAALSGSRPPSSRSRGQGAGIGRPAPSPNPLDDIESELELAYAQLRAQASRRGELERQAASVRAREERRAREVADLGRQLQASRSEAEQQAALLRAVYATKSWRLTRPLRGVRRLFPPPRAVLPSPSPRAGLAAVLFLSGAPEVSRRYRCDHQAEALELLGATTFSAVHGAVDLNSVVERHGAFVLHRVPWGPDIERFLARARELGRTVIFDTDDQVFDPAVLAHVAALEDMEPAEVELYAEGLERYRRTLLESDAVTVSTEPLLEAVAELHQRAAIAPNLATRGMVEAATFVRTAAGGPPGTVTLGYFSGTNTHNKDFLEAADAILHVLDRHASTRLVVVGPLRLDERFSAFGDRIEQLALRPWRDLAELQASVDINLAPLERHNLFTRAKSCIKWIEAGLVGVPTVASAEPDFVRAIDDGANGFLASTPESWTQTVESLVVDRELRERTAAAAHRSVVSAHTTLARSAAFYDTLRDLVPAREDPLAINWIMRAPIAVNSGGYRNIFRIAHDLGERGHTQRLYVEAIAHLGGMSQREIRSFLERAFEIPAHAEIVVGHDALAPADVSIATHWPTARAVAKHDRSLFKAYFIQDWEPDFYDASDPLAAEAERTYSLPLRHICLGRHLGLRVEEATGVPSEVVDFALDPDFRVTTPPGERPGPVRVLFFARPALRRRGYSVGLDALALLKAERPDVEVTFFGTRTQELGEVPFAFTNLGVVDAAGVARAMNASHVLLTFSLTNISNVPYEGMACGCAVVDLDSPNVSTMVDAGKTCVLAPFDARSIAHALTELVDDSPRRIQIANAGAAFASTMTWERTASTFESALRRLCFVGGGLVRT